MIRTVGGAAVVAIVLTASMACGCGPSAEEIRLRGEVDNLNSQLAESRQRNEDLQRRFDELTAEASRLTDRLRALGENVEALESERGTLQSSLDETRRALEELRARERQAQARLQVFRQMLDRFRAMIASGRLRVRITRGRMVVVLQDNILFDSGESDLKPEGQTALAEVAHILAEIPNREFQIAGHTDNLPIRTRRFRSNWELSTGRATTVATFLIENGLPATRVSAAGYADAQPVSDNGTEDGRRQNRRIEIVLVPNLDELPDLSSLENTGS